MEKRMEYYHHLAGYHETVYLNDGMSYMSVMTKKNFQYKKHITELVTGNP